MNRLLIVWGKLVCEYTATTLQTLLATKWYNKAKGNRYDVTSNNQNMKSVLKEINIKKEMTEETFVE